MTIKEVLAKHRTIDETELFLSHLLKCTKEQLYIHSSKALTNTQQKSLDKMILSFKQGVPAAYILGYKYFYGLKFKVNRNTLIPRPDSEWLVTEALKLIKQRQIKNVLDIGTGSGCLAIAIAKNTTKKITISASDISTKALTIAKSNAKTHAVDIHFIHSDLLKNILKIPDLIIANLPYVPLAQYKKRFANLKYEPKQALTDGTDDSILYEKLLSQLTTKKSFPKFILFEIDPSTKPILIQAVRHNFPLHKFPKSKFKLKLTFYKDLRKLYRYAILEI